jgi:hypothetical protein
LMLLEARKTWKLVTDFDDAVFVRLEEEAHVAIIDYRDIFVFRRLARGQLDVSVYPCLVNVRCERRTIELRQHTFDTHWSCRSTNAGLHAPAANTTLSA